jgi:hypothetical protein
MAFKMDLGALSKKKGSMNRAEAVGRSNMVQVR